MKFLLQSTVIRKYHKSIILSLKLHMDISIFDVLDNPYYSKQIALFWGAFDTFLFLMLKDRRKANANNRLHKHKSHLQTLVFSYFLARASSSIWK